MSNPPNNYNTDANFNKFKGTYFNDDVDVSGGDLINRTVDNEIVQYISFRALEGKLNSLNDKVESESVRKLKDLTRGN